MKIFSMVVGVFFLTTLVSQASDLCSQPSFQDIAVEVSHQGGTAKNEKKAIKLAKILASKVAEPKLEKLTEKAYANYCYHLAPFGQCTVKKVKILSEKQEDKIDFSGKLASKEDFNAWLDYINACMHTEPGNSQGFCATNWQNQAGYAQIDSVFTRSVKIQCMSNQE